MASVCTSSHNLVTGVLGGEIAVDSRPDDGTALSSWRPSWRLRGQRATRADQVCAPRLRMSNATPMAIIGSDSHWPMLIV